MKLSEWYIVVFHNNTKLNIKYFLLILWILQERKRFFFSCNCNAGLSKYHTFMLVIFASRVDLTKHLPPAHSSSSHLSSSSPACYCSTLGCVSRSSLSLLCTKSLHSLKLMLHSQFTAGILNWTSPSNKASYLERNLQSKMVAMHVSNSKAVTLNL